MMLIDTKQIAYQLYVQPFHCTIHSRATEPSFSVLEDTPHARLCLRAAHLIEATLPLSKPSYWCAVVQEQVHAPTHVHVPRLHIELITSSSTPLCALSITELSYTQWENSTATSNVSTTDKSLCLEPSHVPACYDNENSVKRSVFNETRSMITSFDNTTQITYTNNNSTSITTNNNSINNNNDNNNKYYENNNKDSELVVNGLNVLAWEINATVPSIGH